MGPGGLGGFGPGVLAGQQDGMDPQ